jgi:hypothetical protein
MAIHQIDSVFINEEEWSGGARSNTWSDEYLYDDEAGQFIVKRWKSFHDAREARSTREVISEERLLPSAVSAEILAKAAEMGHSW